MSDFSRLVHQHHALVFRVARSILRDDAAAEDATQDVYLKILRQPETLAAVDNPRAWLCRVASRRALELAREGARRARREEATVMTPRDPGPEEAAFRSELRAHVERLPEDQRAALSLHYFAGLTLSETAAALEVPQGTVASRVSAGLDRLRKVLAAATAPALLAMLESELRACEADRPVPAGVEGRLLRLEGAAGQGAALTAVSRRRAVGAIAALVAVLAGFLLLKDRLDRDGASNDAAGTDTSSRPDASKNPDSTEAVGESASAPDTPDDEVKSVTLKVGSTGYGANGFLCRTARGLTLGVPRYDDGPARYEFDLPDGLVELAGLPAADHSSFQSFLSGGPVEDAPSTWVEVTVSETRVDDGEVRRTVRIDRIETLNPVWLAAWRDLIAAGAALDPLWDLAPGPDRASPLAPAAERLSDAHRRARAARQGETETAWKRMAESRVMHAHENRLVRAGLGASLGPRPTPALLSERFQSSHSAGELEARLLADFGEDARAARIEWFWSMAEPDGSTRVGRGVHEVRWLLKDGDAAFEAKRREQAELRRRFDAQPVPPATPLPCGATLETLADSERAALCLDGGARVLSVESGSSAAAAGLRSGDILWRIAEREVPADAAGWEERLRKAEGDVTLDIVRDGAVLRVTFGR
jgi:RNA polymerase sigma-70 factor (ECF subfamily)